MNDTIGLTLSDLLPASIEGLGEAIKTRVGEAGGANLPFIEDQALAGLKTALGRVDLLEQLVGAWADIEEIRAYRDPDHAPKGVTDVLEVGGHTLTLEAEPRLHLTIAGLALPPVTLGYSVEIEIKTLALSIKDGAIVAAAPGRCKATTSIRCEGRVVHAPWVLANFKLPGTVSFSPGRKIP